MNLLLLFVEAICAYGAVVLSERLFGKYGATTWVAIATILANILTAKTFTVMGGLTTGCGTVMFASTFLATDILTEKYSKKDAQMGVYMGIFGSVCLIIFTQFTIYCIPSAFDYAHDSICTLFSLSLRITISSLIMYVVANLADIYLYSRIKEKTNGKYMWLRNNVSTILCNCLENFLFMLGAFLFIYDIQTIMIMALSTSAIEIILGLFDTPFLYLAMRKRKN